MKIYQKKPADCKCTCDGPCSNICDGTKNYQKLLYAELEKTKKQFNDNSKLLDWTIRFGKHKDRTFRDLIMLHYDYMKWIDSKGMLHEKIKMMLDLYTDIKLLEEAISYTLRDHYD